MILPLPDLVAYGYFALLLVVVIAAIAFAEHRNRRDNESVRPDGYPPNRT
jgi:hypothetical protein